MDRILEGKFAPPAKPESSLRILTWNVERGKRIQAVSRFAAALQPDICLFQEVDFNARRTGNSHVAEVFAKERKFNYAFAPAFRELGQGDDAHHGQATFSRLELARPRVIPFRYQSDFWKPRWWIPDKPPFQQREGGRVALVAEVPFGNRHLVLYNLHLESRGPERLRALQLEEVVRDADRYPPSTPVVVAGDLNTKRRWSPCIELMRKAGFEDAVGDPERFTTSRGGALARLFIGGALDWIWVRGDVRHSGGRMHGEVEASDHYPLSARLEVR